MKQKIADFIFFVEKAVERIARIMILLALFSMVFLVFINVVLRYFFNSGIPVSEELSRYFFIWTVFTGIVLAFRDNQHIGVTILVESLRGKTQKALLISANLLTSFAIVVMLISSVEFTRIANGYVTETSRIPFSIVVVVSVFTFAFMLLLNVINFMKLIRTSEGRGS